MQNERDGSVRSVRRPHDYTGTARQIGKLALWALIGLFSAHATVYGSTAPFGVGAAAAVSKAWKASR